MFPLYTPPAASSLPTASLFNVFKPLFVLFFEFGKNKRL
ncbi:hypothetical protein AC67_3961 [Escherichia coli 2-052-05_S4_C1]|nr:hypothetical protein AC67_3961 [Escherichia coli 2-052-05_S4_C1]